MFVTKPLQSKGGPRARGPFHVDAGALGGWYGLREERERDAAGQSVERSRRFPRPMMGLGYLTAF